jgi:hypothetical protein
MRGAAALALLPFFLTVGPAGAATPTALAAAERESPAGDAVIGPARRTQAIDYECICCGTHKKETTRRHSRPAKPGER